MKHQSKKSKQKALKPTRSATSSQELAYGLMFLNKADGVSDLFGLVPVRVSPDIVIRHNKSGVIVAFISCKTSLRERHLQDCYHRLYTAPYFPKSIWIEAFERENESDTAKKCEAAMNKLRPFIPFLFAAGFCGRLPDTVQKAWNILILHLCGFLATYEPPLEKIEPLLI